MSELAAAASTTEPTLPAASPPRLMRAARTMALGTAVSRLTGFLRTVVLLAAIGAALVGDAYNTANTLPNIVYELLLGGVLTSVIVPLLVHARERDDDGGVAYTQRLLSLLTVGLLVVTVLAVLAAPLLTYAYGIRENPAQVALANLLARILLVEIVFYGLGAMLTAILNSRQVFGPPAWAPVLNNLVVIGTGLLFIGVHDGSALTPDTITPGLVWLLGIGTTLGIVVQAVALLPSLRRAGVRWAWRWDWRHTGLAEAGRLGLWVIAYVAVSQLGYVVILALANDAGRDSGVGSTVYANASLLFQLPYGIIGVALLTALLPRMSRSAARGDTPALVSDLSLGARLSTIALLPISALLIALGPPIAVVAFARGMVEVETARQIGLVLAASAFGLLPYALTLLQLRAFYAMKDARTPTLINLVMVAVRVPLCLLVPALVPPRDVVLWLAVANSASFVVGAIVGEVWLRSRLGRLGTRRLLRTIGVLATLSAVTGAVAWLVARAVESLPPPGVLASLAGLLAGSLSGGLVLAIGFLVLPLPEFREFATTLRRRFGRTPSGPEPTGPGTTGPVAAGPGTAGPGAAAPAATSGGAHGVQPGSPADGHLAADPPENSADRVDADRLDGDSVLIAGRYLLLTRSGVDADTGAGRLSTWRARDNLLQRDVMLRIHAPGGPAARGLLDRSLAAGVLSHPALAMVYDAVDEGRRAYVVSEWVDGQSLAEALRGGPLPEAYARETIRRVAEGVAQAHQVGLPVGGLVPERIMLTRSGSVTVAAIPAPQADLDGDLRALGELLFATMAGFLPVGHDLAELDEQLTNASAPDLADTALAILDRRLGSAAEVVAELVAHRRPGSASDVGGLSFITDRYDYDGPPTDVWPTISGSPGAGGPPPPGAAARKVGSGSDAAGGNSGAAAGDGSETAAPPTSRHTVGTAADAAAGLWGAARSAGRRARRRLAESPQPTPDPATRPGAPTGSDDPAAPADGPSPVGPADGSPSAPVGETVAAPVEGQRDSPVQDPADSPVDHQAGAPVSAAGAGRPAGVTVRTPSTVPMPSSPPAVPPPSAGPSASAGGSASAAVDGATASPGRSESARPRSDDDSGSWPASLLFGRRPDEGSHGPDSPPAPADGAEAYVAQPSGPAASGPAASGRAEEQAEEYQSDGYSDEYTEDDGSGSRRRTWLVLAFPVAALLAVVLIGWALASSFRNVVGEDTAEPTTGATATSASTAPTTTPTPTVTPGPLTVLTATVFDPFGDGEPENNGQSPLAFDGDPATSWPTLTYRGNAALGGLKPGVGLVFDLGAPVLVSEVTITTDQPGSTVEIRAGAVATATDLEPFPLVGQSALGPQTTVAVDEGEPSRYWVVWITELVPDDGSFSAGLAEVSFLGVPAA